MMTIYTNTRISRGTVLHSLYTERNELVLTSKKLENCIAAARDCGALHVLIDGKFLCATYEGAQPNAIKEPTT